MKRLTTFLAATAFLALMGAVMFLIAGTADLPSVWLYLASRELFTLASVLAMSEQVARERLKEGLSLEALEHDLFRQALDRTRHNKAQAAKLLGLTYDALRYQVKKFEMD